MKKIDKPTDAFQVIIGALSKGYISTGTIAEWMLNTGVTLQTDEEETIYEARNEPHPYIWDKGVQLAVNQGDLYFMEGMLYESREEFRKAVILLWEKYNIEGIDDDEDVELMTKLKLVIRCLTWDIECE